MKRKRFAGIAAALALAVVLVVVSLGPAGAATTPHRDARGVDSTGAPSPSARAGSRPAVRTGKFRDTDSTGGDGNFAEAKGVARCKRGETLTGGGVRRIDSEGLFPGLRWVLQESGPVPKHREYVASALSDLGGLGRKDFIVVALCSRRR